MQQELSELIDEDLEILMERISIIGQMHPAHPDKNYYLKHTKQNIQYMLNLKKKYETI